MIKVKSKIIWVRCSQSIFDRVVELADRLETSNGEIMRTALNHYLHLLKKREQGAKDRARRKAKEAENVT